MGTCGFLNHEHNAILGGPRARPHLSSKREHKRGTGSGEWGIPEARSRPGSCWRGECWFPDVDGDRPSRTLASQDPASFSVWPLNP